MRDLRCVQQRRVIRHDSAPAADEAVLDCLSGPEVTRLRAQRPPHGHVRPQSANSSRDLRTYVELASVAGVLRQHVEADPLQGRRVVGEPAARGRVGSRAWVRRIVRVRSPTDRSLSASFSNVTDSGTNHRASALPLNGSSTFQSPMHRARTRPGTPRCGLVGLPGVAAHPLVLTHGDDPLRRRTRAHGGYHRSSRRRGGCAHGPPQRSIDHSIEDRRRKARSCRVVGHDEVIV